MRHIAAFVLLLLLGPQILFAQADTDTFTINIVSGLDTTTPTTPTLLNVEPVASTQINLSWSASTDDVMVAGYSLFRDGEPIATTTQLTYFDTGLSPSTTYSYTVRAFDPTYNYSSTSNSLSTSTLDLPPSVTNTTSSRVGTVARVVLKSFLVESYETSAAIVLATEYPSRIELRWGRSSTYELGYIVNSLYTREHAIGLTDLEPNTTYQYEIIGFTPHGKENILKMGSFTTKGFLTDGAVVNVKFFRAEVDNDSVSLSWQLPLTKEISQVRIVRSHFGFPEHPSAGAVVYQGRGEEARDENVLSRYSPVYYTAFVYDDRGNVSSGAVAIVYAKAESATIVPGEDSELWVPISTAEATSSIKVKRVEPTMKMPTLFDIRIIQEGKQYSFGEQDIVLNSDQPFTIKVPKNSVAGNLKSIIATVSNSSNISQVDSYLLRLSKDDLNYEAVMTPVAVLGVAQLGVAIYDYEAFVVATYQTPVDFMRQASEETIAPVVFPDILFTGPFQLVGIGLVLLLTMVLFWAVRRRGEDNR